MPAADPRTPRISRETRRLLATVMLSLAVLWILARLRFPERPPTPDPVAPVLSQLNPPASFDELARSVFDIQPQLAALLAVTPVRRVGAAEQARDGIVSLRFREDASLAVAGPEAELADPVLGEAVARDPATGLTVVRSPAAEKFELSTWKPSRAPDYPRYLIASDVSGDQVYLRPLFFGPLQAAWSRAWNTEVWSIPPHADVRPGSVLFSTKGALVGVVAGAAPNAVLVPAEALIAVAERLLAEKPRQPGWLGVEVQPLSQALRSATGVASGVAVTWVHPQGPAAGRLHPTDVVEAIAGAAVTGPSDWTEHVAGLAAGEEVVLRVHRDGRSLEVPLSVGSRAPEPASPRLGLSLRYRQGMGSEVLAVQAGSAGMRAGLRAGDVLTRVGALDGPTPRQVSQAFARARGRAVLAAVARGGERFVTALDER